MKIGQLTFDHATYDSVGDVLYLSGGEPQAAAHSEETLEGHVLRIDAPEQSIWLHWELDVFNSLIAS